MNDKKWTLRIGCHRGTLISRDTDSPRKFDTREEAIQDYQDSRSFWHSIGYQVWFAELIDPEGNKTMLEQNPYY